MGQDRTHEDGDDWVVEGGDDRDVIAFHVTRRRKALGLSQEALAEAMREAGQAHWRQTTVSRIENGKQELTVRELRSLEGILGNVMAGTRISEAASSAAKAVRDAVLVRRLRRLDESLTAALEELTAAREDVRALRTAFDDGYERKG